MIDKQALDLYKLTFKQYQDTFAFLNDANSKVNALNFNYEPGNEGANRIKNIISSSTGLNKIEDEIAAKIKEKVDRVESFKKALKENDDFFNLYLNKIILLLKDKKYNEAYEIFNSIDLKNVTLVNIDEKFDQWFKTAKIFAGFKVYQKGNYSDDLLKELLKLMSENDNIVKKLNLTKAKGEIAFLVYYKVYGGQILSIFKK